METFLARVAPNLANEWQGATDDQIAAIEQIAGRPLPRFYRWFLLRMGRSMGSIAYRTMDFSAPSVLSSYANQLFRPDPRFLMIGQESDQLMPLHSLYDFDYLVRDDARVARRHARGGPLHTQFDTFREMLAWAVCLTHQIDEQSQQCVGVLGDSIGKNVLAHLDPFMKSLGFDTPIPTGARCAIYQGTQAVMITNCTPDSEPEFHPFRLAGNDVGYLRRLLGEITRDSGLELRVREWDPAL